jgi:hypothetical protein
MTLPEAGFSITFEMFDPDGCKHLITMRAETAEQWTYVMPHRKAFVEKAKSTGWTVGNNRPAPKPADHSNGGGQYKEFQASQLIKTFDDSGKMLIKIKGGQYEKFGVPVYEEDFDALGIDLDELKPGSHPFNHRVKAVLKDDGNPGRLSGCLHNQ